MSLSRGNIILLALCFIPTIALETANINETILEENGVGNETLVQKVKKLYTKEEIEAMQALWPECIHVDYADRDPRYRYDCKGQRHTRCVTQTTIDNNVSTSEPYDCYPTHENFVPVCTLNIYFTYEKPEEKQVIGGCGEVIEWDQHKCRQDCTHVLRTLGEKENKTKVALECCCSGRGCNWQYKHIMDYHIQLLDAQRAK